MSEELDRMMSSFSLKDRNELLHRALVYALQRDKVNALKSLIEYSVDMDRFDAGSEYCFLKYHERLVSNTTTEGNKFHVKLESMVRKSRPREPSTAHFKLEPKITKIRLKEMLMSLGWKEGEFGELWDQLVRSPDYQHVDGNCLDKRALLTHFNPCYLRQTFYEMDLSKDGKLELAEMEAGIKAKAEISSKDLQMLFDSIDSNEDDRICDDEYIHFLLNYWLYRHRLKDAAISVTYINATACWEDLIEFSRENCEHFNYFWCKFRDELKIACKCKKRANDEDIKDIAEQVRVQLEKVRELGGRASIPLHPKVRSVIYKHQRALKYQADQSRVNIENVIVYKELNMLEFVYVSLLGDDFRYRMGIQVFVIFENITHHYKLFSSMYIHAYFPFT